MARIPVPCGHEDYPCCGCDNVALTGEDALDVCCPYCGEPECFGRCEEDFVDEPDESMDGDFDSAMASAGHGTDEDYNHYDYGDETPFGEALDAGCDDY
jgi:hypothetical protein